jgi:hypothetical protein
LRGPSGSPLDLDNLAETSNFEGERVQDGEGIGRYGSSPEQGSLSVARAMVVFQQMLFSFRFADITAYLPRR